MKEKEVFLLLGTHGCHLCDVAESLIAASLDPNRFNVDYIDIAYDDDLLELYGTQIPVLVHEATWTKEKGQALAWPFNQEMLLNFVNTPQA